MNLVRSLTLGGAVLALSVGVASAATVSFTNVTGDDYQQVSNDFLPNIGRIVENFDGDATPGGTDIPVDPDAQARTAGNSITTDVGTFAGLGGTGSGDSVTGEGDQIQIRSGENFGRFNPLVEGGNFLDSNDTLGFSWTIQNTFGGLLRGFSAFITDPNDSGGQLTVSMFANGDSIFSQTLVGNPGDGSVWFLAADVTGVVWDTVVFNFSKNQINDGIGIAGATLHVIPLPAPALLLLSGMGIFGGAAALKRRREKAVA